LVSYSAEQLQAAGITNSIKARESRMVAPVHLASFIRADAAREAVRAAQEEEVHATLGAMLSRRPHTPQELVEVLCNHRGFLGLTAPNLVKGLASIAHHHGDPAGYQEAQQQQRQQQSGFSFGGGSSSSSGSSAMNGGGDRAVLLSRLHAVRVERRVTPQQLERELREQNLDAASELVMDGMGRTDLSNLWEVSEGAGGTQGGGGGGGD
jgi:hypothetical protein